MQLIQIKNNLAVFFFSFYYHITQKNDWKDNLLNITVTFTSSSETEFNSFIKNISDNM